MPGSPGTFSGFTRLKYSARDGETAQLLSRLEIMRGRWLGTVNELRATTRSITTAREIKGLIGASVERVEPGSRLVKLDAG